MEFFFRGLNDESVHLDILKCPFLRNINEPTNFSFTSSMACPMPASATKGPIFEDGPNFNVAFKLFHGSDGVVPLSGKSFMQFEDAELQSAPRQFNPLAAKAASISLSGLGGPFGFDAFFDKFKNQKRKSNSSKGGNSKHEASSNEWLESGNCPLAKSFRAVSHVVPLVAKALQPPPGMKIKCPPAIVAARAALARTAFVKSVRPQALPTKVLMIGTLGMAANVPLGIWREHTKKFSPSWFVAVHAAVPFIAMLRKSVLMPKAAMAFTIAASILGQVIGSRAERYRLKAVDAQKLALVENLVSGLSEVEVDVVEAKGGHGGTSMEWSSPSSDESQNRVVGVKGGHCGAEVVWGQAPLQVARSSPADVFC